MGATIYESASLQARGGSQPHWTQSGRLPHPLSLRLKCGSQREPALGRSSKVLKMFLSKKACPERRPCQRWTGKVLGRSCKQGPFHQRAQKVRRLSLSLNTQQQVQCRVYIPGFNKSYLDPSTHNFDVFVWLNRFSYTESLLEMGEPDCCLLQLSLLNFLFHDFKLLPAPLHFPAPSLLFFSQSSFN